MQNKVLYEINVLYIIIFFFCFKTNKEGETFGDFSFFSGFPRKISVKCGGQVAHLAFIDLTTFLSVISNFDEDYV